MRSASIAIVGGYIVLSLVALLLVPLNAVGAFGMEPDPLSGIFALLLSMPWSLLTGRFASDTNTIWNLGLTAVGMALNAAILAFLCRKLLMRPQ